jgi:hypothetical protein
MLRPPASSSRRRSISNNDDYCAHFFIQCLATVAAVAIAAAAIVSIAALISVVPPLGILVMAMCCWLYLAFTCSEDNENAAAPSPRQATTFFIVNPVGLGHMGHFSPAATEPTKPYTYATRPATASEEVAADPTAAAVAATAKPKTRSSITALIAARLGYNRSQPRSSATSEQSALSPINGFMAR